MNTKSGLRALTLCAVCLLWLDISAAGGETAIGPAQIPEWAMGSLCVRQAGAFFEKIGEYADQIIPNSAELAKQKVLATLFELPVNDSLQRSAPFLLYILDPLATGTRSENALVLMTADREKTLAALTAAFGAPVENAGMLIFTLPQPLPQPDKLLVVKISGERLFVAPNATVLRQLEEFAGQKSLAELGGVSNGDDALLTLKVERFKHLYGGLLEACFENGAQMAAEDPEQRARISAQVKAMFSTLWQVDCLEAHLSFSGQPVSAALEIGFRPVAGSVLAATFQKGVEKISGLLAPLFPQNAILRAALNVNNLKLGKWVQQTLAVPQPPAVGPRPFAQALHATCEALGELLPALNGDVAFSVSTCGEGLAILGAAETEDSAKAAVGFKKTAEKFAEIVNAYGQAGTGENASVSALKELPPEQCAAETVHAGELEVHGLSKGDQAALQSVLDWPLTLRYAAFGKKLLVGFGKESLAALKAAIDKSKQLTPSGQAAQPGGAFAWVEAHPLAVAQAMLTVAAPEAGGLTAGLPDEAITFSARMTADAASLKITLPASAPKSLFALWQRMQRANIDLGRLFGF